MGSRRKCSKGHHIWYFAGWDRHDCKIWKCAHCPAHTNSARIGNQLSKLVGV